MISSKGPWNVSANVWTENESENNYYNILALRFTAKHLGGGEIN